MQYPQTRAPNIYDFNTTISKLFKLDEHLRAGNGDRSGEGGGAAARISNELRPRTPVVVGDSSRVKMSVPQADTYGRGAVMKSMFVFPQELVERQVPQPARRLTRQSDRQPGDAVKVSAVMVDVTREPVYTPVPAGLAGADGSTNSTPPLARQVA